MFLIQGRPKESKMPFWRGLLKGWAQLGNSSSLFSLRASPHGLFRAVNFLYCDSRLQEYMFQWLGQASPIN